MKNLSIEIEETVDLSVQDGNIMIFIDQVVSDTQKLRAVSSVGDGFPIYSCANGKAILATMSNEAIEEFIQKHPIEAQTDSSITDIAPLMSEIEVIRKKGIAFDKDEHCEGVSAVGIAIEDPYGRNIAISIPVPSVRFNRNKKLLSSKLIEYKKIIELALGKDTV